MEKTEGKTIHNYMVDFLITDSICENTDVVKLKLMPSDKRISLGDMNIRPGQFVQVKTPDNATFLRRPISICNVDISSNQLWLLVRNAGNGSRAIMKRPSQFRTQHYSSARKRLYS